MLPAEHNAKSVSQNSGRNAGVSMGAVAHAAGIGIGILSFSSRIKEVNRMLSVLTGFPEKELKQKNLFQLCAPEHRSECIDMFKHLTMGMCDDLDLELKLVRADLLHLWVHVTGKVIPGSRQVVITVHDSSDYFELLQDMEEDGDSGYGN